MEKVSWQPENLENADIKLVPLVESDFERIFSVASDKLIWEQHPTSDRYKREVFQLYFDGAIDSKSAFLIMNKANDEVMGSTRYYDYRPDQSRVAIGYTFLGRQYWGGRTNQMLKQVMLDYAFKFIDEVYFHIGETNIRSQMAIKKIGARKVGEVDFDYYGKKLLHYEYLIDKKSWANRN